MEWVVRVRRRQLWGGAGYSGGARMSQRGIASTAEAGEVERRGAIACGRAVLVCPMRRAME
eukprot:scaffold12869_cov93-Isochrysis_galbana.AAC.1